MDESTNQTLPPTNANGAAPAVDEDWSGRTLGEFHILRIIGRGGMGQVYLAEQKSLKRKVAIKMLRPELAANRTSLLRFRAEAEAVARLSHANIVQVYAISEQDGTHFMALEYVEGRNLRDYLNRKGPPDLAVSLSLMRQIAAALQRAHEAGFVHRDVKPENILLTRKGEVKVTDFGLSRCFAETAEPTNLTQTGVAMGTPLYMSPEQVQGKPADPRSDVYSYGVTCYHLFAGSPPFRGASAFDVAVQHVQNTPPPLAQVRPDLPHEVCAMIHKMMAKNPDERYQSFKEILRDLNRVRDSLSGVGTVPMPLPISGVTPAPNGELVYTAMKSTGPSRRKWIVGAGIAALTMIVLASGAVARIVRHRMRSTESTATVPEKLPPFVSSEERTAQQSARQFADPGTEIAHLRQGMYSQMDLAVFYFKQDRLDDVEQFGRELVERKYKPMPGDRQHPYRALGKLCQALAAAFRDRPEALAQLGELIRRPGPGPGPFFMTIDGVQVSMFDNPELHRIIADALNRIATNLKVKDFSQYTHLNALMKPQARLGGRPKPP